MKEKYKSKPYKHQDWPKMFFHPVTAEFVVCLDESEIPEGFVADINKCKNTPTGTTAPKPCLSVGQAKPSVSKPVIEKPVSKTVVEEKIEEEEETEEDTDDQSDDVEPTLESLKITRKDAMALLKEENVKCPKNAPNSKVAKLVSELLKEG